jgi:hypothetical protein
MAGVILTILESPYAGDIALHTAYARIAMADSLSRGEAPLASHLLYTQPGILDDSIPSERTKGIEAGLAWGAVAERTAVYMDLGLTPGMKIGVERARQQGRTVETRTVGRMHMVALLGEDEVRRRETENISASPWAWTSSALPARVP